MQFLIASEARSNQSTYADRGISGELQAKIGMNLPKCFATQSKLRLSYKIDIKPSIDEIHQTVLQYLNKIIAMVLHPNCVPYT